MEHQRNKFNGRSVFFTVQYSTLFVFNCSFGDCLYLINHYSILVSYLGFRVRAEETPPHIVLHPSDVVVKVDSPATLSCRAEGTPKPTIEWLHNGQSVDMKLADSHLPPIVLSDGSIFFLSVTGEKKGLSHEGIYTCVAKNSAGKATSRNASLYIAGGFGAGVMILLDCCLKLRSAGMH